MREDSVSRGGGGMKIIMCYEDRLRPDSTAVYFLNAARKLGHDVVHVYPNDIMNVKPGDADFYFKCDDGICGETWNPSLKPSGYFVIDTHIESDWRLKFAEDGKFDQVFVSHPEGLNLPWKTSVEWLPVACDPEVHHVGEREKLYDGCFIGNFHTGYASRRIEVVHAFFSMMEKPYFGNRTFKEMTEKYAQSKLVLNQSINGDKFNMRFFEVMCSGSCLVTERLNDSHTLGFVDGVHYAGYSSIDELKSVVKDLLSNDDKREGIARNGRRMATQHTYVSRFKTILEKLPQLTETR